ncbi:MAG TPA: hypothetical protein VKU41_06450, partial [Polyangiaceae bacterium]|nr:hypothetical protein [Polyangiaceae bacterium]
LGVREHEPLENPGVQPLSDQTQQHSVPYPSAKDPPEVGVFDGVEGTHDILPITTTSTGSPSA